MVWRRPLVPSACTLRALHSVIQVAMGREGIHLYPFCLRAAYYGSSELRVSLPEVTLAALRLRQGARFTYEYDLNIPWRHEVRIEDHIAAELEVPARGLRRAGETSTHGGLPMAISNTTTICTNLTDVTLQ